MFERLYVQILAPYTGWKFGHFFILISCKNCTVCLKRLKINEKEAGVCPFLKKMYLKGLLHSQVTQAATLKALINEATPGSIPIDSKSISVYIKRGRETGIEHMKAEIKTKIITSLHVCRYNDVMVKSLYSLTLLIISYFSCCLDQKKVTFAINQLRLFVTVGYFVQSYVEANK